MAILPTLAYLLNGNRLEDVIAHGGAARSAAQCSACSVSRNSATFGRAFARRMSRVQAGMKERPSARTKELTL
jgi:hypothetical protein